ncbi:MAG: M6 family metalloprotease domain-containing protein [Paludibacteraceae bacterium]|nr:M6 family metalloprotease domain-containing protein [Paludibacteraceae bacterium]
MKKILSFLFLCALAVTASAVPARRGWQTRTQADGTTIEIQQFGDEFYHYMINRAGKQVREINGMYVEVGEAPTPMQAKARRAKVAARRQRKAVGTEPNLAPKGVVILANFKDKSMQSSHTQAVFDELCNSANCTVNDGYPSAAQYFADQSNGAYRPVFDVFGPVTLSRNLDYYGHNIDEDGYPTDESNDNTSDQYATDAVVEACILANQKYTINWADYDSDSDGKIDFVYVIYAGQGEADGGAANTIWPHNWEVSSALYYSSCTYTASQCIVGGKKIENYAMSGELSGSSLGGIGTLCHEFGHVMGLPDLYDTSYGTVYENCLTPNDWDIMDGGSYNGDGHCPPNYDPWEKDFFGWLTPINLGNEGQNVTLYANGTENYQTYQINASGTYVSPTTSGLRYYIENRQAVGWDAPLTGHGMLIWKVNFNASAWENNAPNESSTSGAPLYTVVSATGTAIGWDGSTDNCPKNTFPGSGHKTSYTGISGKPLLNIAESGQLITLTYIEEPVTPVDPFTLTFMANGREFATTQSTGTVVLPATNPLDCPCGKFFLGWTKTANYESETAAPTYVKAGDPIAEATTLYAVYAEQSGESGEAAFDGTNGGTFKVYAQVGDTKYYATSTVSNSKLQATTSEADAAEFVFEAVADGFTIKAGNSYIKHGSGTNISASNQSYTWTIEAGSKGTWRINSATNGRALIFRAGQYNVFGGYATSNVTASGTEYYDLEIGGEATAAYSDYSTACGCWYTGTEQVETVPAAQKVIRNGQMVILVGNEVYSLTGSRLE